MSIVEKHRITRSAIRYMITTVIPVRNLLETFIMNYIAVPTGTTNIGPPQNQFAYDS